ncbi:ricin-type beta-trefoil lectin domain protein [Aerosakkonema funiforme]|uniref:Ricin-type beta-trefoil lectin domain protein n=1 Tax=Aerosakkonema funiforme FACHB-1375 TaxID=2949571 RepID=A0A926VAG1_9CYAN|nr:ricin-type beta-trefoil lectin domain protein [Aerosakkonema funiforme]MBD2180176.1 ricin-type beta-trefoil lectin domain protein [Aerosakkonema funiforme FACHB-1375]
MKKASLPKSSSNFIKLLCGTLSVSVCVFLGVAKATQLLAQTIPSGFYKIMEDTGVRVYKKDYQGGKPDYVTVVDLRKATIRNLTGSYSNGNVYRKSLNTFWNDAVAMNTTTAKAKVVINGTFFDNNGSPNPTKIAFGLKVRNNKISYGYGLGEFPGKNRTLAFNSFGASTSIQSHSNSTFDGSTPDVVGALDVTANKSASEPLERTFVGNIDSDGNGVAETLLLFSTLKATQAAADNVLKAFGATSRAMLDGGGSTFLIIDGNPKISTTRTVPHAVAVYAGKPENPIKGIGGKCLDVSGGSTTSGTQIQIWDCNGTAAQKWSFTDGVLRGIGGKCLDVSGANTANGTKIQIWDCNGTPAQKWTFVKDSVFRGIGGKCLDVNGGNTTSGTKVQLWDCNNSAAQSWQRID